MDKSRGCKLTNGLDKKVNAHGFRVKLKEDSVGVIWGMQSLQLITLMIISILGFR